MLRSFLLLVFFSLALGDPYSCHNEVIVLDSAHTQFTNKTLMAGGQNCQWNFTFPSGYVAEISINGSSMQISDSVQLFSQWGPNNAQSLEIRGNGTTPVDRSLHLQWPPSSFEMNVVTGQDTTMELSISIHIQTLSISGTPKKYTTSVNQQPNFVQFKYQQGWQPYSTIQAIAQPNSKLTVSMENPGPWDYVTYANIFVYEGKAPNLVFIGTLNTLILGADNDFYTSSSDTLTFYKAMETGATATLIINDHENMKNVMSFATDWSPYAWPERNYQSSVHLDASLGPAALTVLNEFDGSNAIYLESVTYVKCPSCPGNTNSTSPVKVLAGGMIQDYDNQGTLLGSYRDPAFFDDRNYPQYLPGTARTFVLEEGIAIVTYSSVQPAADTVALNGRNGFLMSNNYPFTNSDQNSKNLTLYSVDGSNFTFEYTIETQFTVTYYLNLYLTYQNKTHTNQTDLKTLAPGSYNVTAEGVGMRLVQGGTTTNGTLIPYRVSSSDSVPTPAPVTDASTSTPSPAATGTAGTTVKSTTIKSVTAATTTAGGAGYTSTPPTATTGGVGTTPTPANQTTTTPQSQTTTTHQPAGNSSTIPGSTEAPPITTNNTPKTTGSTAANGTISTTPSTLGSTAGSPQTTNSLGTTASTPNSTVTLPIVTTEIPPQNGTTPTTPPTTTPKAAYNNFGLTALIASLVFLLL